MFPLPFNIPLNNPDLAELIWAALRVTQIQYEMNTRTNCGEWFDLVIATDEYMELGRLLGELKDFLILTAQQVERIRHQHAYSVFVNRRAINPPCTTGHGTEFTWLYDMAVKVHEGLVIEVQSRYRLALGADFEVLVQDYTHIMVAADNLLRCLRSIEASDSIVWKFWQLCYDPYRRQTETTAV